MTHVINYARINEYIYEYLSYVIEQEEIIKNDLTNEDKYEEFIFKAGNDWEHGYDFIEWLQSEKNIYYENLMTLQMLTEMYKTVNNWYSDNYGDDCLIDWKKITPSFVLRHYIYYFINSSLNEVKENLIKLL